MPARITGILYPRMLTITTCDAEGDVTLQARNDHVTI